MNHDAISKDETIGRLRKSTAKTIKQMPMQI